MLQRIQTLYLLIAEILMVSLLFFKFATFLTADGAEIVLKYNGFYQVVGDKLTKSMGTWPLATILIVSVVVGFIVILLYRHRLFQIRVCFFNMVMSFGVFVLIAYYISSTLIINNTTYKLSVVDLFPLIAIFFYFLAYRGIAKDFAMVMADSFRSRVKSGRKK